MMQDLMDLNIKQIKLDTGEEIVSIIAGIDKTTGSIILERPVMLEYSGYNYMFADYMPTAYKGLVTVYSNHIVAQCEIDDSMKESYIRFCLEDPEPTDQEYDDFDYQTEGEPKTYH